MPESIFILFFSGLIILVSPIKWKLLHTCVFFMSLLYLTCDVFLISVFEIPLFTMFSIYTTVLMSVFLAIYSIGYFSESKDDIAKKYCAYFLWTVAAVILCFFAIDFLLFLVFWGISGLILYLLNNLTEQGAHSAKKSFIMLGAGDALLLLGIALIWKITGTTSMANIRIDLNGASPVAYSIFLLLVVVAFTKVGVFPFHTWVPEFAASSPLPAVAFMPVVMDKILGIYLFHLIVNEFFVITKAVSIALMLLGAATIIFAVMCALVQHNYRRLLAYHAVSQTGYMVMGIASLNPLGIFGGLFHMFNNVIYKTSLYLSGGNAELKKNTAEMEELGGLSKIMPISFLSFLLSSLAISGIPPFNGFSSKWLIYKSIIENNIGSLRWLILVAAMLGSSLTLASFLKVLHALYLSRSTTSNKGLKEVSWSMFFPPLFLAVLSLLIGIFSREIVPTYITDIFWVPEKTTFLLFVSIFVGFIVFVSYKTKVRKDENFAGGEEIVGKISGVEFYKTISDLKFLNKIYAMAQKKYFDIYELLSKFVLASGSILSSIHTGILHTYLAWCLLAGAVMFLMYMK